MLFVAAPQLNDYYPGAAFRWRLNHFQSLCVCRVINNLFEGVRSRRARDVSIKAVGVLLRGFVRQKHPQLPSQRSFHCMLYKTTLCFRTSETRLFRPKEYGDVMRPKLQQHNTKLGKPEKNEYDPLFTPLLQLLRSILLTAFCLNQSPYLSNALTELAHCVSSIAALNSCPIYSQLPAFPGNAIGDCPPLPVDLSVARERPGDVRSRPPQYWSG